jgi:uncharacterized protein
MSAVHPCLHRASAQSIADDPYLLVNLESEYQLRHVNHQPASPGDATSWRHSVTELAHVLRDCGLGHVYMFIEYLLDPNIAGPSSAPIDVLLAGTHPVTRTPSFIAIELKQWSEVEPVDGMPDKVWVPHYGKRKPHPAAQVDRNRVSLLKHLELFGSSYNRLEALAYLHLLASEDFQWITAYSPGPETRVITGRTPSELRTYLLEHFDTTDTGGAAQAAELLSDSRVLSPSVLQTAFGEVLAGRASYNLIDEQREVFERITAALEKPSGAAQDVFLVEGRPGTGKSVVAVELLRWARAHELSCLYVSGGTASRTTFQRHSRGHGKLFVTLKALAEREPGQLVDIVIVDEAHRLPQQGSPQRMLPGTTASSCSTGSRSPIPSSSAPPGGRLRGTSRRSSSSRAVPDRARARSRSICSESCTAAASRSCMPRDHVRSPRRCATWQGAVTAGSRHFSRTSTTSPRRVRTAWMFCCAMRRTVCVRPRPNITRGLLSAQANRK